LVSCYSKVFTSIINNRLASYCDVIKLFLRDLREVIKNTSASFTYVLIKINVKHKTNPHILWHIRNTIRKRNYAYDKQYWNWITHKHKYMHTCIYYIPRHNKKVFQLFPSVEFSFGIYGIHTISQNTCINLYRQL
jgi:hypothetical protein